MAITVDYSTPPFLITVPKSDLTLEGGTRYILTVDELWLLLRDFTDNQNAMAHPKLYRRVPATSGTPSITEINDPYYVIQFEDGLYSVNIVDGNTNIREVEIKNQVSVNVNNVAGENSSNNTNIANIQYLIEATRPHHTGTGTIWYWNPDTGDDFLSGRTAANAFKTFAAAHNAAGDGTHDVIVALTGSAGQTVTTETIEITKSYLFLRGPGRDFRLKPTSTTVATICINAIGVEVSGLVVDTAATGGQSAIEVQDGADFFFIDHCWSRDAQHAALKVLGSTVYGRVDGCFFSHPVDSGVHVEGNTRHLRITNTEIDSPGADGIHLEGTTVRNNIIGNGVKIYNSAGYGIRIDAPGTRNHIDSDVALYDNALGNILDNGTLTANDFGSSNLNSIVDGSLSVTDALNVILAAVAGEASGATTAQMLFYAQNGTTPRITADHDGQGNRTSITLNTG